MIRQAGFQELEHAVFLASCLWPEHSAHELRKEYEALLTQREAAIFLAEKQGRSVGFVQCGLRHDYVEGTASSPVGYLEGIFVQPDFRGQGLGRALLEACEAWALGMGCREFASDCELDNAQSLLFHLGAGFSEANRLICFCKKLPAQRT